jgi:hypothetical protein
VTAPQYYAVQLLAIRREQDRMGELEAPLRDLVIENPTRTAWRAGMATLLNRTGRDAQAQAEFDVLGADGFERVRRDGDWMVAMALSADLATRLDDPGHAAPLYDLLLPFAATNVVIGLGAVCLGSTSRYLGGLALTLGHRDAALNHLRHAVQANTELGATLELAHTQLDLARALGDGSEARQLIEQAEAIAAQRGLPAVARLAAELRGG